MKCLEPTLIPAQILNSGPLPGDGWKNGNFDSVNNLESQLSYHLPLDISPTSSATSTLHPVDDIFESFDFAALPQYSQHTQYSTNPGVNRSVEMSGFFSDSLGDQPLVPLLSDDTAPVNHTSSSLLNTSIEALRKLVAILRKLGRILFSSLFKFGTFSLDFIALRNGWSPIWVTTGTLTVQLCWIFISEFCYESKPVEPIKSSDDQSVFRHNSSSVGSTIDDPLLSNDLTCDTATPTYLEGICLRTSETLQFNLEFIDLVLPIAFLYFLISLIPLLIIKNCLTENGICETLSISHALILAVVTLTAQFVRAASRGHSEAPASSLPTEYTTVTTRLFSRFGSRSPPEPQSSNMMVILKPTLSAEEIYVDRSDTQQLFSSHEASPSRAYVLNSPLNHRPGARFGLLSILREFYFDGWRLLVNSIVSIIHAPEMPHLILLSFGLLLLTIYQLPAFTILLLIAQGGASLILKNILITQSTRFLLRYHRIAFEYHLCVVELAISIIFLILSLNQLFIEFFFLSDVLVWKVARRNALSYFQFIILLLSVFMRVISDSINNNIINQSHSSQSISRLCAPQSFSAQSGFIQQSQNQSTHENQTTLPDLFPNSSSMPKTSAKEVSDAVNDVGTFRWAELTATLFWFIVGETGRILFDILSYQKVGSFSSLANPFSPPYGPFVSGIDRFTILRYFCSSLLFVGLVHSVVVRNRQVSSDRTDDSSDSSSSPITRLETSQSVSSQLPTHSEEQQKSLPLPVDILPVPFDVIPPAVPSDSKLPRIQFGTPQKDGSQALRKVGSVELSSVRKSEQLGVRWLPSSESREDKLMESKEVRPREGTQELILSDDRADRSMEWNRSMTRAENQRGATIESEESKELEVRKQSDYSSRSSQPSETTERGRELESRGTENLFTRTRHRSHTMRSMSLDDDG